MPFRGSSTDDVALMSDIGQRIRLRRLELGLKNPVDLIRLTGLLGSPDEKTAASNLGAIERGKHYPKPAYLVAIAHALGVPASHFLGDLDVLDVERLKEESYHQGYRNALSDMTDQIAQLRRGNPT